MRQETVASATLRIAAASAWESCWPATRTAVSRSAGFSFEIALFTQIAASGLTINGYTGTTSFLGGIFSLDGIHPSNTGYAVVANKFIDTMNASMNTKIPDVALAPIAATDPLWPPNLVPHARPLIMPASAARQVETILRGQSNP